MSYFPPHLEDVFDVLTGKRMPFEADASKVLCFMLRHSNGCDIHIGLEGFILLYPKGAKLLECRESLAAPVLSQLLTWAGVQEATDRIRAVIGPETVHAPRSPRMRFPAWSFGLRMVWLDATLEHVKIYIRDGSQDTAETLERLPLPFPQPACPYCGMLLRGFHAKQCRHCKRDWHDPENLRQLGDSQNSS
jgi:hypothetical protein